MTDLGSCKRWYSSRDLAAHSTLKSRIEGQDTRGIAEEEPSRGAGRTREEAFLIKGDCRKGDHLLLEGESTDAFYFASDADDSDVEVKSDDESDDDNEDEDDTLALLTELEQIRKKKTEEKLKKQCFYDGPWKCRLYLFLNLHERLEQEEELKVKEAELLRGNPLLNNPASFRV